MHRIHRIASSRPLAIVVAVGLAGTMASGVAIAGADKSKAFTACSNSKGVLSLLSSKGKCHSGASKVQLGARGPAGSTGPQGATGATGATGDTGPAGIVTGYYDFNDNATLANVSGFQTVATLPNLPAGSYLITAKLYVTDTSASTPTMVSCELATGGDSDLTVATIDGGNGTGVFPLEVSHVYSSTGTAIVECENQGNADITPEHVKILAVPVNSIVRTSG